MKNNFFEEFFNSLVNVYVKEIEAKKKKEEIKIEKRIREKKKINVEERIREGPLIIRKFPQAIKPEISKIASPELSTNIPQKALEIIKKIKVKEVMPEKRERFLESMKEFKPELTSELMPELMPSIEIKPEEKIEVKKVERFNFAKLNEFVYMPNIDQIQCNENENIIIRYINGKVETKDLVLTRQEILDLIKRISEKTKMPIERVFEAYIEEFFIHAEINQKVKLIIKRIL